MSTAHPPPNGDMHLRIWLGGLALDFRATRAAALVFFREWSEKRCEAIELITKSLRDISRLPRLPCEELFHNQATPASPRAGCGHRSAADWAAAQPRKKNQ
ncbi:hypothetical protein [Nocardia sp. AB354]|uniref:hypothetical protein n=1 Tax=Nocardia sp. AB354 TaxID=3413283 RepID=UPI003C2A1E6E